MVSHLANAKKVHSAQLYARYGASATATALEATLAEPERTRSDRELRAKLEPGTGLKQ
ncbi:MAG: hypothetical protein AAF830_02615 [Pseudomonadota bacterium]